MTTEKQQAQTEGDKNAATARTAVGKTISVVHHDIDATTGQGESMLIGFTDGTWLSVDCWGDSWWGLFVESSETVPEWWAKWRGVEQGEGETG